MEDLEETVMELPGRMMEASTELKFSFCTNGIFNEDQICFLAWFSRSSQILSQDSELVLLSGGKSFNSA